MMKNSPSTFFSYFSQHRRFSHSFCIAALRYYRVATPFRGYSSFTSGLARQKLRATNHLLVRLLFIAYSTSTAFYSFPRY